MLNKRASLKPRTHSSSSGVSPGTLPCWPLGWKQKKTKRKGGHEEEWKEGWNEDSDIDKTKYEKMKKSALF